MISLADLQRRIASGELSADAAIAQSLEAIGAQDRTIGAFVCRADNVRAASAGPLRGIAVGIKDIMDTSDFPTEMGSPIYRGHRSRGDAAVVMMLKQAGASIVGKTTTTAFASSDPTPTVNPHNHGHTPGGSSSGSAAAVGAGMIPLALGTQTGGSVIRPASFCGVAAIKPSYRLLPTVGVKCYSWTLDTVGLFAAGVGGGVVPGLRAPLRARARRHDRAGRIVAAGVGADAAHRHRDPGFRRRARRIGR
jgi:Asp-tRNA(Asn)/Glu-tRNA(Gln) amidotransferase A subunit family amidase